MSKKELLDILSKTSEIEKLLTPMGGSFMPTLKTINGKVEFQIWKEELKLQLGKLKKEHIIVETLELLDTGFQNGVTDEKDFISLQGKLKTISLHINDFFDEETEEKKMVDSQKLKKGTKIKTAFDEYTLIGQVGSGGNGRVFSAKNKSEEDVAVKFVEQNIDSKKLKRFKNEIHFCEHHKHDNIVTIIDRGYVYLDEKDYVFYVMPLYADSLKKRIKAGIPHEKALDVFVGILKGLKYAHENKTVHRDIKPENIMFAEGSWEPIICDFGIAHFAEDDLLTLVETKPGERLANFAYAAPEQYILDGKSYPQTDIYAAALILNEMFTGEIIKAAGYTKIQDINKDYAFLDDIFEQLNVQKPEDRLYPIEKIISEIKLLSEKHHREEEAKKLRQIIYDITIPDNFEAKIINIESVGNRLVISFNLVLPDAWIDIITSDRCGGSRVVGYGPEKLSVASKNQLYMPLRGSESAQTLKMTMENIVEWTNKTNLKYSDMIRDAAKAEQRRKEQEREAEIKKLENESRISDTVQSIFKDLF